MVGHNYIIWYKMICLEHGRWSFLSVEPHWANKLRTQYQPRLRSGNHPKSAGVCRGCFVPFAPRKSTKWKRGLKREGYHGIQAFRVPMDVMKSGSGGEKFPALDSVKEWCLKHVFAQVVQCTKVCFSLFRTQHGGYCRLSYPWCFEHLGGWSICFAMVKK